METTKSRALGATIAALIVIAIAFVLMGRFGTGDLLAPPAAPLEGATFERVALAPGELEIHVRNSGQDQLEIAQVLIDEAYWQFTADGPTALGRLETTVLHVKYPWVEGEPVGITILTAAGTTFEHEIAVAAETPTAGGGTILGYILLGLYAGVVPVLLGLLFLPALRRLGSRGLVVLLGITAGMLVFLALDGGHEALELGGELPGAFQGTALALGVIAAAWFALAAIARKFRGGAHEGLRLALLIAVGIGLHNLGEGLAIGSAHALGNIALGTFLVIGFALHNLTEGIGILAPVTGERVRVAQLVGLGAIAGLPTIAGTLIGGFAYSPLLALVFLSIGVGAILQVVWELIGVARRRAASAAAPLAAGIVVGFALMYATGLLIKS